MSCALFFLSASLAFLLLTLGISSRLLPQIFCTCFSFCLEYSSPISSWLFFFYILFELLLKGHFLMGTSSTSCQRWAPLSLIMIYHSTLFPWLHSVIENYFVFLLAYCLFPPLEGKPQRTRNLFCTIQLYVSCPYNRHPINVCWMNERMLKKCTGIKHSDMAQWFQALWINCQPNLDLNLRFVSFSAATVTLDKLCNVPQV